MFEYFFATVFAVLGALIFLFPMTVSFLCFGLSAYAFFNSQGTVVYVSSFLQMLINQ